MMTNEEILSWAKSISYARVNLDDFCMHYGREKWTQGISELSEEQKAMLVKRIEIWEKMRAH